MAGALPPFCSDAGAAGPSTLPRMMGRPSLPLPITTTFEFWRLRERQRRLDAAPAQIGIGNALADRLLERRNAVRLDLLALRFFGLAHDAMAIFLDQVELLGLPVDRADDGRRQLDAEHQRVEYLNRVLQGVVVVFRVGLLHRFRLDQLVEVGAEALAHIFPDLFLDDFAGRVDLLRACIAR